MPSFSSLIEILNAIENRLDSVLSDSKDTIKFNESIKSLNELENLLKILNDFIINNNNEKGFNQDEKALMKKVLNSIIASSKHGQCFTSTRRSYSTRTFYCRRD